VGTISYFLDITNITCTPVAPSNASEPGDTAAPVLVSTAAELLAALQQATAAQGADSSTVELTSSIALTAEDAANLTLPLVVGANRTLELRGGMGASLRTARLLEELHDVASACNRLAIYGSPAPHFCHLLVSVQVVPCQPSTLAAFQNCCIWMAAAASLCKTLTSQVSAVAALMPCMRVCWRVLPTLACCCHPSCLCCWPDCAGVPHYALLAAGLEAPVAAPVVQAPTRAAAFHLYPAINGAPGFEVSRHMGRSGGMLMRPCILSQQPACECPACLQPHMPAHQRKSA